MITLLPRRAAMHPLTTVDLSLPQHLLLLTSCSTMFEAAASTLLSAVMFFDGLSSARDSASQRLCSLVFHSRACYKLAELKVNIDNSDEQLRRALRLMCDAHCAPTTRPRCSNNDCFRQWYRA